MSWLTIILWVITLVLVIATALVRRQTRRIKRENREYLERFKISSDAPNPIRPGAVYWIKQGK